MQVTLNIDASQMGDTVLDIFKNLTTEQRSELAMSMMKQWFADPIDFEKANWIQQEIMDIKKTWTKPCGNDYWSPSVPEKFKSFNLDWTLKSKIEKGIATDEEIMFSAEFQKYMVQNFTSTRDMMVQIVIEEARKVFNTHVSTFVKEDPQMEEIKNTALQEVVRAFPEMAQHALVSYFIANMNGMANQLNNMNALMPSMQYSLQNVLNKLNGGNNE